MGQEEVYQVVKDLEKNQQITGARGIVFIFIISLFTIFNESILLFNRRYLYLK